MKDYYKIKNEWDSFMDEIGCYKITNDVLPHDMDHIIEQAVECKRKKQYYNAFKLGKEVIKHYELAYSEMLMIIYKNLASAGCLVEAFIILDLSLKANGLTHITPFGEILTNQGVHMSKLIDSIILIINEENDMKLKEYLKSISGNENYELELDKKELEAEITQLVNMMKYADYIG